MIREENGVDTYLFSLGALTGHSFGPVPNILPYSGDAEKLITEQPTTPVKRFRIFRRKRNPQAVHAA